jgi:hypothetical protein
MIQEFPSPFFPTALGIQKPRHATHRAALSGGYAQKFGGIEHE